MSFRVWKKGERALLVFSPKLSDRRRTVEALIILASPNGLSLAVSFEAMVNGYVGMMPLSWMDDHFEDFHGRHYRLQELPEVPR